MIANLNINLCEVSKVHRFPPILNTLSNMSTSIFWRAWEVSLGFCCSIWWEAEGPWLTGQRGSRGASGHLPRAATLHPPASYIHALLPPHHLCPRSPAVRTRALVTHRTGRAGVGHGHGRADCGALRCANTYERERQEHSCLPVTAFAWI